VAAEPWLVELVARAAVVVGAAGALGMAADKKELQEGAAGPVAPPRKGPA